METAYLSFELSSEKGDRSDKEDPQLTPVETVDMAQSMIKSVYESTKPKPTVDEKDIKVAKDASIAPTEKVDTEKKTMTEKIGAMDDEEVIKVIQQHLQKLHTVDSYKFDTYLEEFKFFKAVILLSRQHQRKKISAIKEMTAKGIVKVFRKLFQENYDRPFATDELTPVYNNMYAVLITLWNGTDAVKSLCDTVVEEKLYIDLFKYLDHEIFLPANVEKKKKLTTVTKGFLGILHNVIQKCDVRALYRDCDGVRILEKFNCITIDMVKSKSMMVLAYIINEDENEKLNLDDNVIDFIVTILKDTLKTSAHHSKKYGYRTDEILDILIMLAANDLNKTRIVNSGAIKYFTELMGEKASPKEQAKAARAIWTLAFRTKDDIIEADGCVDALKALAQKSDHENVKKQASGALWVLEGKHKETVSRDTDKLKETNEIDTDGQHIMISYQWANQEVLLKVRDKLQESGYKVWMDVDKMSGSILEAMANSIEQASVVLICMSQKYKESPNCRTEGDYAFAKRKPIVPLLLQYRYKPDGWLGALVGSLLYFDFSVENKFQRSFNSLIKELGNRGKQGQANFVTADKSEDQFRAPPAIVDSVKLVHEDWSVNQVKLWLEENGLKELTNRFISIDGSLLEEYKLILRDAPEFFYKSLETGMNLSLPEILKFTKALRKL